MTIKTAKKQSKQTGSKKRKTAAQKMAIKREAVRSGVTGRFVDAMIETDYHVYISGSGGYKKVGELLKADVVKSNKAQTCPRHNAIDVLIQNGSVRIGNFVYFVRRAGGYFHRVESSFIIAANDTYKD